MGRHRSERKRSRARLELGSRFCGSRNLRPVRRHRNAPRTDRSAAERIDDDDDDDDEDETSRRAEENAHTDAQTKKKTRPDDDAALGKPQVADSALGLAVGAEETRQLKAKNEK